MLRISKAQIAALRAGKLEHSRWRIVDYLRQTAPELTHELDNKSLYTLVRDYEVSGIALGLRSERAHAKWAFLMLTTRGEFNAPPIHSVLADPEHGSPDRALDRIMAAMIELEAADAKGSS